MIAVRHSDYDRLHVCSRPQLVRAFEHPLHTAAVQAAEDMEDSHAAASGPSVRPPGRRLPLSRRQLRTYARLGGCHQVSARGRRRRGVLIRRARSRLDSGHRRADRHVLRRAPTGLRPTVIPRRSTVRATSLQRCSSRTTPPATLGRGCPPGDRSRPISVAPTRPMNSTRSRIPRLWARPASDDSAVRPWPTSRSFAPGQVSRIWGIARMRVATFLRFPESATSRIVGVRILYPGSGLSARVGRRSGRPICGVGRASVSARPGPGMATPR